jgi:hypothetical protein
MNVRMLINLSNKRLFGISYLLYREKLSLRIDSPLLRCGSCEIYEIIEN